MSINIENTMKDYEDVAKLVMLVYGVGGIGKTTFASTFPNALLIDFENGSKYFKKRGINIDVVRMSTWFSKQDIAELQEKSATYETIIIDPIGEAMEKLIKSPNITGVKYRQGGTGDLTIAGWGKVKDEMRSLVKWAKSLNKNVVLVAHVDEKESDGSLVKRPLIATKINDEIIAMVDVVGYMDIVVINEKERRALRVNPSDERYIAKDRTGSLPGLCKPDYNYILKRMTETVEEEKTEPTPEPEKKPEEPKKAEQEPVGKEPTPVQPEPPQEPETEELPELRPEDNPFNN